MKKIPLHFHAGIFFITSAWALNWSLPGLRTHILFFPLWFGYILFVDSVVQIRKDSSLIKRSLKKFILLFVISAPAWWLFELLNERTGNWVYVGKEFFTDFEYAAYATLSFSTVMPAVFETAELFSTFRWTKNFKSGNTIGISKTGTIIIFVFGWISLALLLLLPNQFFYLIWISVFLVIEPVNIWLRNRSIFDFLKSGNHQSLICLIAGCLTCGLFWEMWNYYSYPKWIYYLPIADFAHIFEMPLLGYIGYIPFSLELFSLYNLVTGVFNKEKKNNFLEFT